MKDRVTERKESGGGGCLGIKEHECGLKLKGWETRKQLLVREREQVRC